MRVITNLCWNIDYFFSSCLLITQFSSSETLAWPVQQQGHSKAKLGLAHTATWRLKLWILKAVTPRRPMFIASVSTWEWWQFRQLKRKKKKLSCFSLRNKTRKLYIYIRLRIHLFDESICDESSQFISRRLSTVQFSPFCSSPVQSSPISPVPELSLPHSI